MLSPIQNTGAANNNYNVSNAGAGNPVGAADFANLLQGAGTASNATSGNGGKSPISSDLLKQLVSLLQQLLSSAHHPWACNPCQG